MSEQDNPEIPRRNNVIGIWFSSLLLLSVATCVLIPHLPTKGVCYFRDIWFLRSLWYQNLTVFDQFKQLWHSNSQQCVFFATRSMLSLYFATIASITALISRPEGRRPAWKGWPWMAIITVLLVGKQIFFDGFDDQSQGYYKSMTYRTYDSINSLILKSVYRMVLFYALLTFWLLIAIDRRRNRVHGDREA
ncbi:hypothetical protein ACCS60_30190 [Rhizobium acaciae]|uniref:hypothetical protein n=1 Tax=Rhizobium acaciae TaxID=2989736 RepID=UPI003F95B466